MKERPCSSQSSGLGLLFSSTFQLLLLYLLSLISPSKVSFKKLSSKAETDRQSPRMTQELPDTDSVRPLPL